MFNLKALILIILLSLSLVAQAKGPLKGNRSVQSIAKSQAGKEFYQTCVAVMKKNKPTKAEPVCGCIVRNLENNIGPNLSENDIRIISKSYQPNTVDEDDGSESLELEFLFKFERVTATACLNNSNAIIPMETN